MPPCPLKPLSRKPPMRPVLSLLSVLWLLASPAHAQCIGENLIAALPAAQQETLRAKAESAPFATGNFWRARKGEQVIHLIGTYHFDDPRHAPLLAALAPVLDQATTLLVEAGPEEEAAIKAYVAKHPEVMIDPTGPTLPERLSKPDWARLSDALRARGIPPFMAAKFRPWYLSMLLGIPPCSMAEAATASDRKSKRLNTTPTTLPIPLFFFFNRTATPHTPPFPYTTLFRSGRQIPPVVSVDAAGPPPLQHGRGRHRP